jgi:hypothetical protein
MLYNVLLNLLLIELPSTPIYSTPKEKNLCCDHLGPPNEKEAVRLILQSLP